jgi:MHS family shikimate/dehydroshikimate transporter-like MFS transporter
VIGGRLAPIIATALAPIIATALTQWAGGASWPVATYLAGIALIGLVAVCLASDKYRMEINDQGGTQPHLAGERR